MQETICGLVYATNEKSLKVCCHLSGLTIFDLSFLYGKLVALTPCGIVDEYGHITSSNTIVATTLSTGISHAVALTDNGLYSWGNGKLGQLGLGVVNRSVGKQTQVEISEKFVALSCGANHSMAITKAGVVYGWGDNSSSQLGLNSKSKQSTVTNKIYLKEDMSFKPKVVPFSLQQKIASVSCGSSFSVLLTQEGHVWTCGSSECGQLGHGSLKSIDIPTRVSLVRESTNEQEKFHKIAAGYGHVLALTLAGDIYSWGLNTAGQLGLGDNVVRVNPSRIVFDFKEAVVKIYANGNSSAAISSVGTLFTWGSGKNNRLLNNEITSKLNPSLTSVGEQCIRRFTFGPTSSAICIESKITQVWPNCGPAHDTWEIIVIQGSGLWINGDAVARFEFEPSNQLNCEDDNTQLRTIIECSAQLLNGELICSPPPFNQIGRYSVSVSLDGVNYLEQHLSIRVYPRFYLHPPASSIINVFIDPVALIVIPLEIEDYSSETISNLLSHKYVGKLMFSDDPFNKSGGIRNESASAACRDFIFKIDDGRLRVSETIENMYELVFHIDFMDSRITSYVGRQGGCFLSMSVSFNGQDFCKPYPIVKSAFIFVHNSRLSTLYPDCLLEQSLDFQSKTGEAEHPYVVSEPRVVKVCSKPPLHIYKLPSNIDISLDAIYEITTHGTKIATIIRRIPVSNYLSPGSTEITLCPPSIYEILECWKLQTSSFDDCQADINNIGVVEEHKINYVKVHVKLRLALPPAPSYRNIVNTLTSSELATEDVISSLLEHLMCIIETESTDTTNIRESASDSIASTDCDSLASTLNTTVEAPIDEKHVVIESEIANCKKKGNQCKECDAIDNLPEVLELEPQSASVKKFIFAEGAFITLITPHALEIYPSFARLSEKAFVHLIGLRYLPSHCRIFFCPFETCKTKQTANFNWSRFQVNDCDAMIEMIVEMDDDENFGMQKLEHRNYRLKLPRCLHGQKGFHSGKVCVYMDGHSFWPTRLSPCLHLFDKLVFSCEVKGKAGAMVSCLLQGFSPPDDLESKDISKCIVCLSVSPLTDHVYSHLICAEGGHSESIRMNIEGNVAAIREAPLKGSKLPGPIALNLSFTLPTIDTLQENGFLPKIPKKPKRQENVKSSLSLFLGFSIDNGQSFDCSDSPILQVKL